ncbi:MAG TPA: hypothetical protein VFW75_10185 [Acetobacteraceae bacterium]|nr:hypothetical protein [Acetobacteraceae bacterium]
MTSHEFRRIALAYELLAGDLPAEAPAITAPGDRAPAPEPDKPAIWDQRASAA